MRAKLALSALLLGLWLSASGCGQGVVNGIGGGGGVTSLTPPPNATTPTGQWLAIQTTGRSDLYYNGPLLIAPDGTMVLVSPNGQQLTRRIDPAYMAPVFAAVHDTTPGTPYMADGTCFESNFDVRVKWADATTYSPNLACDNNTHSYQELSAIQGLLNYIWMENLNQPDETPAPAPTSQGGGNAKM